MSCADKALPRGLPACVWPLRPCPMTQRELRKPANTLRLLELSKQLADAALLFTKISLQDVWNLEETMPTIPGRSGEPGPVCRAKPGGVNHHLLTYWLQANLDGFRDSCAMKIGRRILLDQAAVAVWLEAHRPVPWLDAQKARAATPSLLFHQSADTLMSGIIDTKYVTERHLMTMGTYTYCMSRRNFFGGIQLRVR